MITCNVAKDLLPSYIDELVSVQTAREIAEHLEKCADCQAAYEEMKAPVAPIPAQGKEEIDHLKKIKAKSKSRALKYSAISVGAVIALVAAFFLVFIRTTPVSIEDLDYTTRLDANGSYVIEMTLKTDSALHVDVEMEYEGINRRMLQKIILSPRQAPEFLYKGNRFFYGFDGDLIEQFKSGDFDIIMNFADKTVGLPPSAFE